MQFIDLAAQQGRIRLGSEAVDVMLRGTDMLTALSQRGQDEVGGWLESQRGALSQVELTVEGSGLVDLDLLFQDRFVGGIAHRNRHPSHIRQAEINTIAKRDPESMLLILRRPTWAKLMDWPEPRVNMSGVLCSNQ